MNVVASVLLTALVAGTALADTFTLRSPDVTDGATLKLEHVYNSFGCAGKNIAPALTWAGEPAGTKSFAVTVYDPDAPTGSGWWHWLVINLPATTHALPAASGQPGGPALPTGAVQTMTDFGQPGFGGACPPPGDKPHRYIFTVWALKTDKLALPASASGAMVGYNLNGNALG
jgi:hypothetical protein